VARALHWRGGVRQSERILSEGAAPLPDAELMRVVLGARDELLAARLLSRGLSALRRASIGELLLEPGMTAPLAARLIAALELGRRVALAPAADRRRLLRAHDVAAILWGRLAHLAHEEFWAVLMNARLQEIRCVQIARGGLTQCSVSPREAFAPALVHRAPAVAFVHNHPSGDPAPSAEDQRLQLLLDEAGRALGIRVVDHLVLAEGGLHSAVEGACAPPDAVSVVPREGVG
jgi:DNA repair protein RadC